ncbi:MAG TPA: T9SS type A sorting domain-containing protein, partial [Saprospiraceae bacterium]|nr:T9SS type A sorting domain-containing protein [Saprospiraceae bacterium]
KGSYSLPNKTGNDWIIITSSQINLLPKQGTRITPTAATGIAGFPTQQDAMPKIITTNLSGVPCFYTKASAHHYRLVGLEIGIDFNVINSYGLVQLGDGSSAQNTLTTVPHDFIIDRCYIHGHTNATVMKAGILLNCANSAVIDSYISDFHSIGFDTYTIGCTNGPGPFKIINNYLEAAGENIIFGGAAASIPGLVPSDIEVKNNYMFKPYSWKVDDPTYAGKHWTIKNLFELKTGVRVLVEGNIMENSWADLPTGQSGAAILLTVRAEGGGSPQANVKDITIRNNIIKHAGNGISLSGHDDQAASLQTQRIKIANNLFEDINGPAFGDGNVDGPNDGTFIKIGDPQDVFIDHNTIFQTGAITWVYDTVSNFNFTNNMLNCFLSAGGYQGMYGPGFAQGGNGPMGAYFPDITDTNQHFNKNVLIGGNSAKYTNYATISKNYFPASAAGVNFVDYNNGSTDYHNFALSNSSIYKNFGSDGKDIGVDFNELDAALNSKVLCTVTNTSSINNEEIHIIISPNPFNYEAIIKLNIELKDAGLSIFNIMGQELKSIEHIYGNNITIDRKEIPNGYYFCKLFQGNNLIGTWKIVVF